MNLRAPARTWGGRTTEERRAERRARLIDAALEIWLDSGWAAVTMRGVCTRAALNDRYFYEHFADRDELLVAAWDDVNTEVLADLGALVAERIADPPLEIVRAAIALVVQQQSTGRARILFADHAGSAVLEERRKVALIDATDLLVATSRPYLRADIDETEFRMSALFGIGGFIELLTAWRTGAMDIDGTRIADQVGALTTLLGAQYLAPNITSTE
ncbi:TetR/AcrR family transcriptional regulator [Nocardia sp. GCM10030253]|uniref:TetR/AcrR family transcriptional regulator n=1 Tax=Nocardia sp. GCM10030253 TaxID=3273404 RepID=UPI00363920DD